ncbi:hypothetical protein JCM10207_005624 [Rhodosporidiobolus poonsookiae]
MTPSPAVQSLLHVSSPRPPTSPSPSSAPSLNSTTPSESTTQTLRSSAPTSPTSWGSTITSAFGFGTFGATGGAGARTVGRGKTRARLPDWGAETEQEGAGDVPDAVDGQRRSGMSDAGVEDEGATGDDELDELAESILLQAGVDSFDPPGPLLVIACSQIPPPTEVSHTNLLARLRLRLERFASSGPYSVILLVNPTPHAPATAHLVSTFLSLTRQARKNVRRIWVVGGGWWTRVIITLFSSTLLSAKFAKRKKLAQCSTLSDLAQDMGAPAFVQVEFPLEVYSANATSDQEIKLPPSEPPLQRTFGVPVEELTGSNASRLPAIVRDCVDLLLSQGPESVGIFRRSPSAAHVKLLESAYDRGNSVSLSAIPDAPYLAASLLKLFLRSLPSPILPSSLFPTARACPRADDLALPYIRTRILPALSAPNLLLLHQLCGVLSAVAAQASTNLMTSENLVICLCPALIGGLGASKEEIEMCRVPGMDVGSMRGLSKVSESGSNTLGGVLRVMIDHYDDLFGASTLSALAPGVRRPLIASELDLTPSSPHRFTRSLSISSTHSHSLSLHSAPRSPISSIPEDGGAFPRAAGSSSSSPSSGPPLSPSARRARALPPVADEAGTSMARSLSRGSLASTASFASAASGASARSGTLRLHKTSGGTGLLLRDAFAAPLEPIILGSGGDTEEVAAAARAGKSGEELVLEEAEGELVQPSTAVAGEEVASVEQE